MHVIMTSIFAALGIDAFTPGAGPQAAVKKVMVDYRGKKVKGRRLSVRSTIPMPLEKAWENVKTPALLQFIARGMIKFHPVGEPLPKYWEVGQTYAVSMRIFGFLPFGGAHYLFIEKIDEDRRELSTREWDKAAKVWNHDITMRDLGDGRIQYEDVITIYGGWMTGFITAFAKQFYKYRQRRWQLVAKEGMDFTGNRHFNSGQRLV